MFIFKCLFVPRDYYPPFDHDVIDEFRAVNDISLLAARVIFPRIRQDCSEARCLFRGKRCRRLVEIVP